MSYNAAAGRGVVFACVFLLCGSLSALDFTCVQTDKPQIVVTGGVLKRLVNLHNSSKNVWATKNKHNPTAASVAVTYLTDRWWAGLSGSFETGHRRMDFVFPYAEAKGKFKNDTYGITAFGGYKGADDWYVKGNLFFGYNDFSVKEMRIVSGYAWETFDTDESKNVGASAEFGKTFTTASEFRLTPHIGIDYACLGGDGSLVRTPDPMRTHVQLGHQDFIEVPVGVKVAKSFCYGDWTFTPAVDAAVIGSFRFCGDKRDTMNTTGGSASYNGTDWNIYAATADKFGGKFKAAFDATFCSRFSANFAYEIEVRKKYVDNRFSASLGVAF